MSQVNVGRDRAVDAGFASFSSVGQGGAQQAGSSQTNSDGDTDVVGPPAAVAAAQHDHVGSHLEALGHNLSNALAGHQLADLFHTDMAVHQIVILGTNDQLSPHRVLLAWSDLQGLLQQILQSIHLEVLGVQAAEHLDVSIFDAFQTNEDFKRNVVPFGDAVIGSTSDDNGGARFFSVNCGYLQASAEVVFGVLVVENAVARAEGTGLDVADAAEQQLQLIANRSSTWVLGLGEVLSNRTTKSQ